MGLSAIACAFRLTWFKIIVQFSFQRLVDPHLIHIMVSWLSMEWIEMLT